MPAEWAELGVVVIAEDVGQRFRRGRLGLDVRVRIDETNGIEFGEQTLAKLRQTFFNFGLGISDCGFND